MSNTDSQNWEQLQDLFHRAGDAPYEGREQVLADLCPDPRLRQRVLDLLDAASFEPQPRKVPNDRLHGKLGPYSLLRHLGTGGIGSVYLAERMVGGTPQRSALKVLAPHAAGPAFVERFHREQHILASLEHANITRMLDAGLSHGGQPYLVMEYVDGRHLDVYCDDRKMTIHDRLLLFLQVCDAVAYAHRNLVVHLDLKPSNILVTADGKVKLLDFGTSKLIQPDSLLTTTVMATPAYASPEQLRNEAVTTACDIYSLGAILFELLSGRRPGGKNSVAIMIERAMREEEPERLESAVTEHAAERRNATLARLRAVLHGDLGNIVTKCLRALPKDRYSSLDALMADVRSYLDGRPVTARKQTTLYRAKKFVRRNRGPVVAATLASLLLVSTLGYAEWRQQQAIQAGQRAQRERDRAEHINQFLTDILASANPSDLGYKATVVEVLDRARKLAMKDVSSDPSTASSTLFTLSNTYRQLGDYGNARDCAKASMQAARSAQDFNLLMDAESGYGAALQELREFPEAKEAYAQARSDAVQQGTALQRAIAALGLSEVENDLKHWDAASHWIDTALQELPASAVDERVNALVSYGDIEHSRGNMQAAIAQYRKAVAYGATKTYPEGRIIALGDLSNALYATGQFDEAASILKNQVLPAQIELLGENHTDVIWSLANLSGI